MKEIILLSALALVHGATIDYNSNGCPKNYAIEKLLPHDDCKQFYQCLNGMLMTRNCPYGLYFDSAREMCDWPQNTNCKDIPQNNINEDPEDADELDVSDPSQAPKICATPKSNGVLVAHEICNKYYKCSYGHPVAMKCPSNLLFNPTYEQCDWPEKVDCGTRVISENDDSGTDNDVNNGDTNEEEDKDINVNDAVHDNPSEAPAICAAEGSDGVLIAHENCNQFYKCSEGHPVALSCPLDLLYNPSKKYCDWPQEVDCGDRVIPKPEDDGTVGGGNGQEGDGNDETEVPDNEINSDPSKAPEICAAEGSDGVLIAHENCNQFYKCSEGHPVALSCPLDLLYNPSKKYCDWPQEVDCGDRVIPKPDDDGTVGGGNGKEGDGNDETEVPDKEINSDPSKAPEICAAEGSDGVLIAHENCNQFYKCSEGHPVALSCPLDLLYNPSKKYCDWPQEVDCGDRVIPKPDDDGTVGGGNGQEGDGNEETEVPDKDINSDPSKAPEICAADGSDGVLIAHEICNKFYKCSEGLPVAIPCPGNLLYNPSKKYCDWPHNVECGDRSLVHDEDNVDNEVEEIDYGVQAATICAHIAYAVHAPHEHCNQFYKCVFGLPMATPCPSGLLYNSHLEVCDWPINVECGSRDRTVQTQKKYLEAKRALKYFLRV